MRATNDTGAGLTRGSESPASRVWIPDLVERIARHLPPNELPCTLRLVDKATAALFSGPHHTTVRLSQPVPHHAFAQAWGQPSAAQPLTLAQRQQLLCLTAATGVTPNLELLLSVAVYLLTTAHPMEAAASAGQLATCLRLRQAGCPWDRALVAAAGAGHLATCEGLLAAGCPWSGAAVTAAVRGGHTGLLVPLLQAGPGPSHHDHPGDEALGERLVALARGCDLPALQRYHQAWLHAAQPGEPTAQPAQYPIRPSLAPWRYQKQLIPAAAGSPTPDWQAKVEWLEGLGYPKTAFACHAAAGCTDAAARLAWLRGRGYPVDGGTAVRVCAAGDVAALRYLLAEGVRPTEEAATEAAAGGHLAALQALHAAGCPVSPLQVACAAAKGGHLAAVAWAVVTYGAAATLDDRVFARAGRFGSAQGEAYVRAARNGDLQTLACLRRLGCPWGPVGAVFGRCLDARCPLAALRWLAAEGCPLDWRVAAERARARYDGCGREGEELVAWVDWERDQRLQERRRRLGYGRLLGGFGFGSADLRMK
ncbi:hypothetical protein GPECTOR_31g299 [Gonium pectorale]|uniref:Ankyrin repeat domain-containing protein n=1 Tax=Gonium pectorale TaxID=33097 RepID=A0A150GDL5_GONPE|nr:hypothetical protein GPECTOR_31g299 [Gonium pectorale]|eukprot:KXZ47937.1 hypothetical protein GPECTOR_31g299 [Gonium pectorale]